MATHLLYETPSGYAIFDVKLSEEIGAKTRAGQESINDYSKFSKMVSLKSFSPFKSAAEALENINDISEDVVSEHLKSLLELTVSKPSKKSNAVLGVYSGKFATAIKDTVGVSCTSGDTVDDLIRGVRLHLPKLVKAFDKDDLAKAQLGLGHSYSRGKLKFNVNRIDNMIIQAISLLEQLDKDVNLFSMRIREWYGYHFPELVRLVPDNQQYARVALFVGDKETLDEEKLPELSAIFDDDSTLAQNILDAARNSMGAQLSEVDMLNISAFATRVISIAEYRKSLVSYLSEKMNLVAPNLTALLGERIGAKLISHAGSLTNLSKYPASTVQILGAEKALFRALKTKGNTPKYGLLYHSSYIGRAGPKHKGRISRYLANKCSIASRIDCYSENPTSKFGEALAAQVEERLKFFETGAPPTKNADAIRKVLDQLALDEDEEEDDAMDAEPTLPLIDPEPKEKKKKRKSDAMDVDEDSGDEKVVKKVKLSKEEKKAAKKAAKAAAKEAAKEILAQAATSGEVVKKEKKHKKEKKEKRGEA